MSDLGLDKWELESWEPRFGSKLVKRIAHADYSADYEMNEAHVFQLENGQYAVVVESGCSCYSSDDAEIELFPDEKKAMASYEKWDKENRGN